MSGMERRVERDMLELMVAYGFVPGAVAADEVVRAADRPPRGASAIVGVVGGAAQAGQSTVVAGLAVAWAAAGRSVLLVDLDPSEGLSRALHVGLSVGTDVGHTLLATLRDGRRPEPGGTVLPGVDIVANGALRTWEPQALAASLRADPDALFNALQALAVRYDRVLIDCPALPRDLRASLEGWVDGVVTVVRCEAPLPPPRGPASDERLPSLGALLNRWCPERSPDAAWIAAAWPDGAWLDTVIPELPTLHDLWDVVGGAGGPTADAAMRRLAEELDERLARRRARRTG